MAILPRGYRELSYQPTGTFGRLWPIARHELAAMFRLRFGGIIFVACLLPTIGQLIFLMVRAGIWDITPTGRAGGAVPFGDRMDPSNPSFFLWPITTMSLVPFLVLTTLVSVRAIAKDRAAGALEIYWTRAISPWSYFIGKWYGSFLLLGAAFVAAPFVLWVVSVLLAPDWSQFEHTVQFMPGVLFGLTWMCATLALLAVSVSALASTPNMASILWLFLVVGSTFLGQILRMVLRDNWTTAINPWRAAKRVVEGIAGVTPFFDYSPWVAFAWITGIALVLLGLAARRLRVLEAVAT
jgi:ABC-type transport system involved in multi-copper enzyme maturation permease subunit